APVLDLGAAVLAVDDAVADLDVHGDALVAVLVPASRTYGQDLALLGLLLGGVRDDQTGGGGLLGLDGLDDNAVLERLDGNRHGYLPLHGADRGSPAGAVVVRTSLPAHPVAVAGVGRACWHLRAESAKDESRRVLSTRSSRVPGGR